MSEEVSSWPYLIEHNLYQTKNKAVRPLKDMVRESIFNFLIHSNKISFQLQHANILDLFSGTGSFGLECISRQAAKVFFVENEENAIKILKLSMIVSRDHI